MKSDTTTRLLAAFESRIERRGECWIWTGSHNGVHPQMSLTIDGVRWRRPARAWAFEQFVRRLADDEVALAGDCGHSCVNPNHAQISTWSSVRRHSQEEYERRFWAKVAKVDDASSCWLWTGSVSNAGYGAHRTPDGSTAGAHRVALALAIGGIPAGLDACHHCDVRLCCRPDHLYAGTHQENIADRQRRGRHRVPRGVDQPNAKLTADQVREIRELHATGEWSYPRLAARFGLHAQNIGRVVRREGYIDIE